MFRFSLRTYSFWFVPYVAVCLVIFTALREPMFHPGNGIPPWHWGRFAAWVIVSVVWVALIREDRRALRWDRQDDVNPVER